jgi:hypothetical protein
VNSLHKVSWGLLAAQAVNVGLVVVGSTSPHAAVVAGSVLTILQAVFPSVFKGVNNAAATPQ